MLTRRQTLAATLPTMLFAKIPDNACDCHTHIFGDPSRFPFWSGRSYTPPPALPEAMAAMHKKLGVKRVVIVTPSVYGTDNSATIMGLRARGKTARGIAVIDPKIPDADLDKMHAEGFRGVRLNLATAAPTDSTAARDRFSATVSRLKRLNWHLQIYVRSADVSNFKELILASPVPVVIDHVGGAEQSLGAAQPGYSDLVDVVRQGKAYVKITHRFLSQGDSPDLAKPLIAANPDRVLWGTDWPHTDSDPHRGRKPTDLSPFQNIDDLALLSRFESWVPDAPTLRKILVTNPARLYAFD